MDKQPDVLLPTDVETTEVLMHEDVLIKAFSLVEKDFPEWTLSLWGDIANKRYKKVG